VKILQVTNFFKPSWESGGPARVAYEISKKLIERGHEVTVYTTDGFKSRLNVKTNKSIEIDGMKTYYFRNLSSYLAREMVLPIPYYLPMVVRREIMDFDVIHIHEYRTVLAIVVRYYAKKYGIPYVLQAHGSLPIIIKRQRLKKIFDILFGYRILRDASKVIAISEAEVKQYKQMSINDDKIVVVPDGIDVEAFKDLPTHEKFREKYDIKEDHMILFLGRIHKRKGIDFLIKSFSELTREMSDVVLVIIGPDDRYKVEVEKSIKTLNLGNRIKLIGYVDEKDKLSAYVDADVLVYPAIFEIFGLVPFEAIMCGTPVIVTDDCGCGELVEKGNSGYLVKYGDVNDLKENMKYVIENPEEGKEMVKRGKKYINENLTYDKVVRKIEMVYKGVIA
jgi:glycosyltransferase involved in cell wall biosynthesis